MKLIVGLGNPGQEHQLNRHNIGFMVLDTFAQKRKLIFSQEQSALIAKRSIFKLIKPLTYMNLSGDALKKIAQKQDEILVICDDIYLPLGEIRLRQSGQDGGHNGLASIIQELGSEAFPRMRIGIGKPEDRLVLKKYVLENFSPEELETLKKTADFAVSLIDCFIIYGFQSMLNFYSKNKKSYSEQKDSESKSKGGT